MTIGKRLKELREGKKESGEDCAAVVGTSKQYVWRLENDLIKRPNAEFVDGWAKHYGVTVGWLSSGRPPKSANPVSGESQPERFDDETMAQALDLLYLLADTRPDDQRFSRLTWPVIKVAAKAISRAESGQRQAVAEILAELDPGD